MPSTATLAKKQQAEWAPTAPAKNCYAPKLMKIVDEKNYSSNFARYAKPKEMPFVGCLYVGLMIEKWQPREWLSSNCRFGDPETQAVLAIFEGDFAKTYI